MGRSTVVNFQKWPFRWRGIWASISTFLSPGMYTQWLELEQPFWTLRWHTKNSRTARLLHICVPWWYNEATIPTLNCLTSVILLLVRINLVCLNHYWRLFCHAKPNIIVIIQVPTSKGCVRLLANVSTKCLEGTQDYTLLKSTSKVYCKYGI